MYKSIKQMMEQIKYVYHNWVICVDLKMINVLLGKQSEYTKYSCFLYLWDNRANLPLWRELKPGYKNVIADSLFPRDKIIFPPLDIGLWLMKHFMEALDKEDKCFEYLCNTFPGISIEKEKTGIFSGPEIRKLVNDPDIESAACTSF